MARGRAGRGFIWPGSACYQISTDGGGDGTSSYGTVHVAAAAAMWLRLRAAEIGSKYGAGNWRRVEAFRRILHTTETRKLVAPWTPNPPIYKYKNPWILDLPTIFGADLPEIADDDIKARTEGQNL